MKKFTMIWLGELISGIGSGMTAFALSVYVYQTTGRVSMVSVIAVASFLPTILLSPLGGVLADRYDRRLLMIIGDLLSGLGLLYILWNIQMGTAGILPIIIGVTFNAVFVALLDICTLTAVVYALSGVLADYIFEPLFTEQGLLAGSVGRLIGVGQGRGIGFMLILSGLLMFPAAFAIGRSKNIRSLQKAVRQEDQSCI